MKDLRTFKAPNEDIANITQEFAQNSEYKQAYDKYSQMDEDNLINELVMRINQGKKDGSFDNEQLINFVSMVAPHLTEVQKEKLSNIINVIT